MSIDLDDYENFLARRPPTEGLSIAPWYAQLVERFRRLLRIREIQNARLLALEGARRRGSSMKKTYDPRCHDLAAIFLGDEPELHTPENIDQLARLIQQAIEDFIAFMRPDEAAQ